MLITAGAGLQCAVAHGQNPTARPTSRMTAISRLAPDGVLEPWKTSDVACAEAGIVEALLVKPGAKVKAGDALARLDSSTLQTQLEIAKAQAQAVGKQDSVLADVELNQRKVNAFQEARNNEFGSQLELERAEAELKIAQGRLLSELEERKVLELQVARLEHQLRQHTVVAPIDGIVTELHKEVGEFVAPHNPEVVRIIDISRLRASFFLRLAEAQELAGKATTKIQLTHGETLPAEIENIAPVADSESGLIEVRVLIDNPDGAIRASRCTLLLDHPTT